MAKRRKRRRHVSFGTFLMIALTAGTLCLAGVIIVRLAGDDLRVQTAQIFSEITGSIRMPGTPERPADEPPQPPDATRAADTTPTPEPARTPSPQPTSRTVTISALGSLYAPKNIRQSGYDQESETYDFSDVFSRIKPYISQADLTLATVETYFAGKEAGYGNYNAPDELLSAIRGGGVDLLSLATEYAFEKGPEGLYQTLSLIESRGMIAVGAYLNEEEVGSAQIFQINDVQIAVLAYTYGLSENSTKKTRASERYAVPVIDQSRMVRDIANARKEGADIVIVMPHWGTKNKESVASSTRSLARALAEAGADLIVGAHPNVVQRVEKMTVTRSDGARHDAYVAYSLGSFLTDSRDAKNTAGVILQMQIVYDPATRTASFEDVGYMPTYIQRVRAGDAYTYRIVACGDESYVSEQDASAQKAIEGARESIAEAVANEEIKNLAQQSE